MKRIVIVALCLMLALCTTVAFAGKDDEITTGTTNGGTMGKATCTGTLTWINNTSAGSDGAIAKTESNTEGIMRAYAYIYCETFISSLSKRADFSRHDVSKITAV